MNYKIGFILSSGRTGTVFLAKELNRLLPNIQSVHEPKGSRYQYLLGNICKSYPSLRPLLKKWYHCSRPEIFQPEKNPYQGYIEINPFLCTFADLLLEFEIPLSVVQVVRHPYEWISSLAGFKAKGWRKHIINFVPFNQPPVPAGKPTNQIDHLAWRWRIYNESIYNLKDQIENFQLVKFEEIFNQDPAIARQAFDDIIQTLGHPTGSLEGFQLAKKENPNPKTTVRLDQTLKEDELERVKEILLPMSDAFGYEL